ncbi:MAG TPA: aminotransferase class I/II-fold pyridoxal phosphate-dependent enzyme [Paludibacter sp.]
MINGHGDEIQTELIANFSSNVWYGADNSALYQHLSTSLPQIARYPEADAHSLKLALATQNEVEASQIIVCNGSTEAFYLIANAFSGKKSLIVTPTFSEYADACRIHNHIVYQTNRNNISENIERLQPDLVWICNPNNPDGHCFTATELIQLFCCFPISTFIIDQAYIDFTLTEANIIPEIPHCNNVIVVQSLTKRFAIPGLRLGYIVSSKESINNIEKYKMPWSVNSLAIEAGKYILNGANKDFKVEVWLKKSILFRKQINDLGNYETFETTTPYFLVKLKRGKAKDLKSFLLKEHILIRDATNFEGLEGEFIRICTLSTELNNLLLLNLKIWSQFTSPSSL